MYKLILAVVIIALVAGFGVWCYKKGVEDTNKKRDAEYNAEFGNDWKSDPGVKHSTAYDMGYARGKGMGEAETIATQTTKCGDELAQLAVETGNAKVAGKYLAEGYFAPSQLEAAIARTHKE